MAKLAIGVTQTDEALESHVSRLMSKLRGEWGSERGIKDLEKLEAASRGGLYWEIYSGTITEKGVETIRRAINDFSFAELEGISLPLYLLSHPAARTGFRIEVNGELIKVGGGLTG